MNIEFEVTDLGITIDGRAVLPGSTLKLKANPPSHWQRFGKTKNIKTEARRLEVATPSSGKRSKRSKTDSDES